MFDKTPPVETPFTMSSRDALVAWFAAPILAQGAKDFQGSRDWTYDRAAERAFLYAEAMIKRMGK